MGLGEIALAGLGLVLVGGYAEKSGAGLGLQSLGTGVQTILAAPGVGVGLGLSGTAKGVKDVAGAIGSIFDLLPDVRKWLPDGGYRGPGGSSGNLVPDSGGSGSDNLPGGGGNVPRNIHLPVEFPKGLPKGLGRIYELNGSGTFGFRRYPGPVFSTRREARNYMNRYNAAVAMGDNPINV